MLKLVLLRHGESVWNKKNRFTGWTDVDLSRRGQVEAQQAGKFLKEKEISFDIAYTSVLKRAIRTLWIVLDELDLMWIPVVRSWRLNERHYGTLQGLNKVEVARKYGKNQVLQWRRSYDTRPPLLKPDERRYPGNDKKYEKLLTTEIPLGECLKDTVNRFLPYWHEEIEPTIKEGKRILIAAHGNSLRALVKYLDNVTDEEIIKLNIPTGIPLVYELDENLHPLKHYYLGDPETVQKAIQTVANQSKLKR